MINPDRTLILTPKPAQNNNTLELDPDLIIGWVSFPDATLILIHGPESHCSFTVEEDVETIKGKLRKLRKH